MVGVVVSQTHFVGNSIKFTGKHTRILLPPQEEKILCLAITIKQQLSNAYKANI